MRIILVLVIFVLPFGLVAGDHVELVKQGNDSFWAQDYKSALKYYHDAEIELPESPELEYNMAGALYNQGGYEEAVERFEKALKTQDSAQNLRSHFNLGNTYFQMEDFQKAIEQYQRVLELNPDDMDAKFNLEYARKRLKEQMQDQSDDQKKQDKKDQKDQQEEQEQQPDQQGDQQKPDDLGDQQDQEQKKDQQTQPKPKDEQQMSKEDAERILNGLLDNEQEMQEKVKKKRIRGDYRGKDW